MTKPPQSARSSKRLAVAALVVLCLLVAYGFWVRTFLPPLLRPVSAPPAAARPAVVQLAAPVILSLATLPQFPVLLACDGKTLEAGGTRKSTFIFQYWDVAALKETRQVTLPDPVGCRLLAISPDGTMAALADPHEHLVMFNLQTRQPMPLTQAGNVQIIGGVFSPDSRIFSAIRDGAATPGFSGFTAFDLPRGDQIWYSSTPWSVYAVAISADPRHFFSGGAISAGGRAQRGELLDTTQIREFRQEGIVTCIAVSANCRYILTGGQRGPSTLWDFRSGKRLRRLAGHFESNGSSSTTAVALSADGTMAATGGADAMIFVFDSSTGDEIARLAGDTGPISALWFLGSSDRLASASEDGTVRIWNLRRS
ncbi:MAG TPA: hypothetical protein VMD30_05775 [Tepidisphaeraceae bacterium]|nr:hypothetical protein [Tepidisphaeraceae bacterium]